MKAKYRLMQRLWWDYRNHVMPRQCAPGQVQETRRAFYAGAHGLLTALLIRFEPDHEPTTADLAMMDEVHAELIQFGKDVGEGKM